MKLKYFSLTLEIAVFFVFFHGVVFLTIIVNRSTTKILLQLLGMDKTSKTKMSILDYITYEIIQMNNEG